MTFRNFMGWTTPCPECEYINKPVEGYVSETDDLVLRYLCVKCDQKYERCETVNQVKVVPLMNFRRSKSEWRETTSGSTNENLPRLAENENKRRNQNGF